MQEPTAKRRIWTIPNLISIARLLLLLPLTVILLLEQQYMWSLVAMVLLAVTDWLDGYLARRLNQVTEFGKAMDPIADRVSVAVIGLALMIVGVLPAAFVIVIVATDVVVALVAMTLYRGNPGVPVTRVGKLRTAVLLVALPLLIFGAGLDNSVVVLSGLILMAIGCIGHVVAGIDYIKSMIEGKTIRARTT